MPFNQILAAPFGRNFILTIGSEQLAGYDIAAAIVAAYSGAVTQAGDQILLNVNANVIAANTNGYAVDGDTLHNSAFLHIVIAGGIIIGGRGGVGGRGGEATRDFDPDTIITEPGEPGLPGGSAIRCGCRTRISGTGTINRGFPGGGGGGGLVTGNTASPGHGGGGGIALGAGGLGGSGFAPVFNSPNPGAAATQIARGLGGTGVPNADGGNGGDVGNAATAGSASVDESGGVAGADSGLAINRNGFSVTVDGTVTVNGPVTG